MLSLIHISGKTVLVLEGENYGGQIINSPEVENYPGIAKISGFEFATGLYEQAQNLGAVIEFEAVTRVERDGKDFVVYTDEREIPCHSVILATGAKNRPLGVDCLLYTSCRLSRIVPSESPTASCRSCGHDFRY